MSAGTITWLNPIQLDFDAALKDEERFIRELRNQMRRGIRNQNFDDADMQQCVYVIRMLGSHIIAYENGDSPTLYIGRGRVTDRLARHLDRWLSYVCEIGIDTQVEVRILMPRHRSNPDYYKSVESDLIDIFRKRYGAIPFFNSRPENKYANKVRYTEARVKEFRRLIGIGSGKRPLWAIRPTPANPDFATYHKGWSG